MPQQPAQQEKEHSTARATKNPSSLALRFAHPVSAQPCGTDADAVQGETQTSPEPEECHQTKALEGPSSAPADGPAAHAVTA